MKAMVLNGLNRLEIIEKPDPEISNPDEVLIRMKSVGICGSDIHYYQEGKIGSQVVQYPFTVGHEGAGIVEKTGTHVTRVKPGDRVAIDPAMPCFSCDQCKAGRFHTCRHLKFLGCPGQAAGCLSEFLVMPATSCFVLPDNMTLDQGALSEPLAIGVYATRLYGSLQGKTIGILGSGPIGISVLLPALAGGAKKVYMTDKIDARLALAQKMGAHWTGNPDKDDVVGDVLKMEPMQLDVVFECCGKQEAADQAIQLLKPGGRLLVIGIPSFNQWSFDVDSLRRKEIDIQSVRRQNESVELTLDMISDGRIQPNAMQTHTFGFERIGEAFEMVSGYRDGVMKAMINF
ncbi:MAG: alcohol dehydrogenase catalytic domain-containing protein [Bacteroidales bacterium]|nr:alcohol dehydrogenase catalytic domain-containing protein [Bacteroidales bacterium]